MRMIWRIPFGFGLTSLAFFLFGEEMASLDDSFEGLERPTHADGLEFGEEEEEGADLLGDSSLDVDYYAVLNVPRTVRNIDFLFPLRRIDGDAYGARAFVVVGRCD